MEIGYFAVSVPHARKASRYNHGLVVYHYGLEIWQSVVYTLMVEAHASLFGLNNQADNPNSSVSLMFECTYLSSAAFIAYQSHLHLAHMSQLPDTYNYDAGPPLYILVCRKSRLRES